MSLMKYERPETYLTEDAFDRARRELIRGPVADEMRQEIIGRGERLEALHAFVLEISFVWMNTLFVVVGETKVSGQRRLLRDQRSPTLGRSRGRLCDFCRLLHLSWHLILR